MYLFKININSLIICCLSSGDIHLFIWVVNSKLLLLLLLLLLDGFLEILVILSALLLSIIPPVASAVFWIALFKAVFIASVADFLALSRSFDHCYYLNFYPYF